MRKYVLGITVMIVCMVSIHATETELYGALKYGYNYQIQQPYKFHNVYGKEERSSLNAIDSFVGIRGSHDLGNGNRLIYQLEKSLDDKARRGRNPSNARTY